MSIVGTAAGGGAAAANGTTSVVRAICAISAAFSLYCSSCWRKNTSVSTVSQITRVMLVGEGTQSLCRPGSGRMTTEER